jgi:hypothetical protein
MLTHQARFCSRAAGAIPSLRHLLFLYTMTLSACLYRKLDLNSKGRELSESGLDRLMIKIKIALRKLTVDQQIRLPLRRFCDDRPEVGPSVTLNSNPRSSFAPSLQEKS